MLKNYLRTAVSYLSGHKLVTAINLIGLITGLAVCFFALIYIRFEMSHDRYHRKADRTYRLVTDVKTSAGLEYKGSSAPMAPAILETFPEVEHGTRICLDYYMVQPHKNQGNFYEETIAYADSSLFQVFDFKVISGDVKGALRKPYSVMLSETAAKKYFGNDDALNGTLILDGKVEVMVTGIMEDMPANSHFKVDMLISMSTLLEAWWSPKMANNWKRLTFHTYLVLREGADDSALVAKFPAFIKPHIDDDQVEYTLDLEPLTTVYLYGKPRAHRAGSISTGSVVQLYFVGLVAIFVLFIACFNFVNLATAFSIKRAKEIGVRKALGATKGQLRFQFLVDSVLLSLIAFMVTAVVCALLLPAFVSLSGKSISTNIGAHLQHIGFLFLVAFSVGLISGVYPALFLSNFEAVTTLKGKFVHGSKGVWVRKLLVVAQFSISVFLIISTIVVGRQLHFMKNKPLGFHQARKLVIDFHFDERVKKEFESVKRQLAALRIDQVTLSSCVPGKPGHVLSTQLEDAGGVMQDFEMDVYFVDSNFLDQYGIEIVEGYDWPDRGSGEPLEPDSTESVLINETALKDLGYRDPQEAIGKRCKQGSITGHIIGIVKDFHFHSLKEKIKPLVFRTGSTYTFLTLTIPFEDSQTIIRDLEEKWVTMIPSLPLSYFFLDAEHNELYKGERRFSMMFLIFSVLAVVISCLGLLGLFTFTISQRTKEISIRKILGASITGILGVLMKEFFYLVALAFLIGASIAWMGMNSWLGNFAYRIELSVWIFIVAGLVITFVGVMTIGFHASKAVFENPAKNLRAE